ncbi:TonB-dependent receptor [Sphingobium sp. DEHP117]|uniref:TonB-dependent receptor n=1 Tax=Sphingobium sp. DEHP117 TaxID=2993436 RepID=UPI0027D5DC8A|nr:TonB-dependent receptor [Sphingobium sp. DEHP117]MDQ4420116.1 TonB-dependent receptor [Sphingobium sp. DEHP117]
MGGGTVDGADISLVWHHGGWRIEGGAQVQHARLEKSFDIRVPDNAHLPVVPDLSGRIAGTRALSFGEWAGEAGLFVRYTGRARLSLDPGLDRRMGGYATVDPSLSLGRGGWTFGMFASNLLDSSADSFAFGNPFSVRSTPQFTPLHPRNFQVTVSRRW